MKEFFQILFLLLLKYLDPLIDKEEFLLGCGSCNHSRFPLTLRGLAWKAQIQRSDIKKSTKQVLHLLSKVIELFIVVILLLFHQ